nr:uncharacterized protein LOC111428382 [Onthophagus taurus]
MELTSDLITVQGLLLSSVKAAGSFLKILYKGGNEMKIANIVKELEEFLECKNYINKRKIVKTSLKELESITFFLIVNSQFTKNQIELIPKEYSNLVNITPTLSQCLLVNIIIDLGLVEPYCGALHLIPIELWGHLLNEMIMYLKKCSPELSIEYSYIVIKNIIIKIGCLDNEIKQQSLIINSLEDNTKQLLLNCSLSNIQATPGLIKHRKHKLMGAAFLSILKLLKLCQIENKSLFITIENLVNTASSLMTVVTIDVFCTWAEIKQGDSPLQLIISEEAYQIIEKYQKFKPAKEFIQMLGSVAKKPRTISDQIRTANVDTIIRKVSEDSENRTKWFRAFLLTDVFANSASIECLKENYQLCTYQDIIYLLKKLIYVKTSENIDLFIQCTLNLNNTDLKSLLMRHYYDNGLKNNLGGDQNLIEQQLIFILNKLDSNKNNLFREIILLLLREPKMVLKHLYKDCVKSGLVLDYLTETFHELEDFIEVEDLFLVILKEILTEIKLESGNLDNYKRLFSVISIKPSSCKKLINEILKPNCFKYFQDKNDEDLKLLLIIYLELINFVPSENEEVIIEVLNFCGSVLVNRRWLIYDFSYVKVELCTLCRDFLLAHKNSPIFPTFQTPIHPLNGYCLSKIDQEEFFDKLVPTIFNRDQQVPWVLKVLPLCLPDELTKIAQRLIEKLNEIETISRFVVALVLISELVQTQPQEGPDNMKNGLKYCLHNFGYILKNLIIPLNRDEINVVMARKLGVLLNHLPADFEDIEGFSLAGLIPDQTLKDLSRNKNFLDAIKDMKYRKVAISFVKRMLK